MSARTGRLRRMITDAIGGAAATLDIGAKRRIVTQTAHDDRGAIRSDWDAIGDDLGVALGMMPSYDDEAP